MVTLNLNGGGSRQEGRRVDLRLIVTLVLAVIAYTLSGLSAYRSLDGRVRTLETQRADDHELAKTQHDEDMEWRKEVRRKLDELLERGTR